jgi:hypothetical protein
MKRYILTGCLFALISLLSAGSVTAQQPDLKYRWFYASTNFRDSNKTLLRYENEVQFGGIVVGRRDPWQNLW